MSSIEQLADDGGSYKARGTGDENFHNIPPTFCCSLKGLSNQFFALLPKRFGIAGVERISAYALVHAADRQVIGRELSDEAVLAVAAADLLSGSNNRGPHRGC